MYVCKIPSFNLYYLLSLDFLFIDILKFKKKKHCLKFKVLSNDNVIFIELTLRYCW